MFKIEHLSQMNTMAGRHAGGKFEHVGGLATACMAIARQVFDDAAHLAARGKKDHIDGPRHEQGMDGATGVK